MSGTPAQALARLPVNDLEQVEQLCADFEAAWKRRDAPRLEDYLAAVPAGARAALLPELLALDVDYRRRHGEQPAAADYASRFPQDGPLIDACCARTETRPPPVPAAAAAGDDLPRMPGYEILGVLGGGGMGVVYKARQVGLNRVVALKMIQSGYRADPERLARFRAEAEAVARLQHPHIVQIHEIGEWRGSEGGPGCPFFSLEYVDGGSLAEHLKGNRLSARSAAQLVQIVAGAVHHAHKHGIVHRDLKPANVLLTFSRETVASASPEALAGVSRLNEIVPKVADFGLAKHLEDPTCHTQTGEVMGTPSYMAPEQALGRAGAIGPATDVWALGAILYECLTGRPPFKGDSVLETLEQVRAHAPVPPRRLVPPLPRDLETICLQCLQKEPRKRYASAAALAEDLRRFLDGESILARPVAAWQRAVLWARRQPRTAALLLLVIVSTVLTVGSLSRAIVAARDQTREANQRAAADRQAAVSEQARADGESQARELEQQLRHQAEQTLNEGRVILAEREWQASNVAAAERLLAQCVPAPDQPDLRGWEWHYVKGLCNSDLCRLEHRFWVNDAAFSPDGQLLATAAGSPGDGTGDPQRDGEVKLWEAATGRPLATLLGDQPTPAQWSIAFSPDGRWLLAGDAGGTWRVWEVATRRPCLALSVPGVGFLPDGRTLGVVGRDGDLNHMDLTSGREVRVRRPLQPRPAQPVRAAFGMGGRRLAVHVPGSKTVRVLDSATGEEVRALESPGGPNGLVFSPDGQRLVDADRLWDLGTGQDRGSLGPMWANAQFSPKGDWLARHLWTEVYIHKGDTGQVLHRLRGHSGQINRCAFSPDGQHLATAGTDQTVRVWDVRTGDQIALLRGHTSGVRGLAFSPDGRKLVTASQDQTARVWDLTRDQRGLLLPGPDRYGEVLGNLAFAGDGREVIFVHQFGEAWWERRDAATGAVRMSSPIDCPYRVNAPRYDSALSADGGLLVVVSKEARVVRVWESRTGAEVHALRGHTSAVEGVAISADGKRLASITAAPAGVDGPRDRSVELIVWDGDTGQPLRTLQTAPGRCLTLSPDGRLVAVSGVDNRLRVWETATGTESFVSPEQPGPINSVAFSPDGLALAATGPQAVTVWDLVTCTRRHTLPTSSRRLTCVAFSPGGRRLAAVGYDEGVVHLWDAASGHDVFSLRGFESSRPDEYTYMARVVFSADGRRIAANNWDGSINVWDAGADAAEPRRP